MHLLMDNAIVLNKGNQFRSLLPGGSFISLSLSRANSKFALLEVVEAVEEGSKAVIH